MENLKINGTTSVQQTSLTSKKEETKATAPEMKKDGNKKLKLALAGLAATGAAAVVVLGAYAKKKSDFKITKLNTSNFDDAKWNILNAQDKYNAIFNTSGKLASDSADFFKQKFALDDMIEKNTSKFASIDKKIQSLQQKDMSYLNSTMYGHFLTSFDDEVNNSCFKLLYKTYKKIFNDLGKQLGVKKLADQVTDDTMTELIKATVAKKCKIEDVVKTIGTELIAGDGVYPTWDCCLRDKKFVDAVVSGCAAIL